MTFTADYARWLSCARPFNKVPIRLVALGASIGRELTDSGVAKQRTSYQLNGQMPTHPVYIIGFVPEGSQDFEWQVGIGNHRVKAWEQL